MTLALMTPLSDFISAQNASECLHVLSKLEDARNFLIRASLTSGRHARCAASFRVAVGIL